MSHLLGTARRLLPSLSVLSVTNLDTIQGHKPSFVARMGLIRFAILLKVIPIVVLCCVARLILELSPLRFNGLVPDASITPFTTTAMFVIALMLAGVIEDYKEAEKIPGAIANVLDALAEKLQFAAAMDASTRRAGGDAAAVVTDVTPVQSELLEYATCLFEFLADLRSEQDILALTSATGMHICDHLSRTFMRDDAWMLWGQIESLRGFITRLSVIRRTEFIGSGRALMQIAVWVTVVMIMMARYDTGDDIAAQNATVYSNIAIYTFLFVYVLLLIDDLEDPFEFSVAALLPKLDSEAGKLDMRSAGTADVDVFPLLELYARLATYAGKAAIVGGTVGANGRVLRMVTQTVSTAPVITGASVPSPPPSRMVAVADELDGENSEIVQRRRGYRKFLAASMAAAITNENQLPSKESGGSEMDGAVIANSAHAGTSAEWSSTSTAARREAPASTLVQMCSSVTSCLCGWTLRRAGVKVPDYLPPGTVVQSNPLGRVASMQSSSNAVMAAALGTPHS